MSDIDSNEFLANSERELARKIIDIDLDLYIMESYEMLVEGKRTEGPAMAATRTAGHKNSDTVI